MLRVDSEAARAHIRRLWAAVTQFDVKEALAPLVRACVLRHERCRFYSHSGTFVERERRRERHTLKPLQLCSQCDLAAGAGAIGSSRGSRSGPPAISSWSRTIAPMPKQQQPHAKGARGRPVRGRAENNRAVPTGRGVQWRSMVRPRASTSRHDLVALAPPQRENSSHRCLAYASSPQPPLRPLFAPIGIGGAIDPSGSVWVANRGAGQAIPSHGWAEITHCPAWAGHADHADAQGSTFTAPEEATPSSMRLQRAGHRSSPFWHQEWLAAPMWLYVASGSGVSINVGKTRAFESYEAVAELLSRCRFGISATTKRHWVIVVVVVWCTGRGERTRRIQLSAESLLTLIACRCSGTMSSSRQSRTSSSCSATTIAARSAPRRPASCAGAPQTF